MLKIAHLTFPSYVALAPMAGITDLPFRNLCGGMGAGLTVGEMTHSNPSLKNSRKTKLRSSFDKEGGLRSVQIVGSDPGYMAAAARYNEERGAELIDINMGCPAKKVLKKAAGSALLSNEKLVADILQSVVSSVSVPVTLKYRTGPTPNKRNGVRIAKIAEANGISGLAVHGRTRECKFQGCAEYATITKIVGAVGIPVLANGDINSPEKAMEVMSCTGAAGVMLGRSVLGQPWLCGQIDQYIKTGSTLPSPSREDRAKIIEMHLKSIHSFYGEDYGVRFARKHVGWYFKHIPVSQRFKRYFNTLNTASEQISVIRNILEYK
ncbi:MAG: tRNA dihydrouridine synthase DusB [Halieaceae bacterium]|nr:tRNA dihydrouridine synthase DusB [Halieaceae bacterium]